MESFPFFVYGSLRPGEDNYFKYFFKRTSRELGAFLMHYAMYGRAYPVIIPTPKPSKIRGNLLYVPVKDYRTVLREIDALEGFDPASRWQGAYCRVIKKVYGYQGNHHLIAQWAWVYHANRQVVKNLDYWNFIPSGDWLLRHHS